MHVRQEADALMDVMRTYRRYLHSHAEVGLALPETAAYVTTELTAMGITPSRVGDCGVTALIGGGEGKTVLLRADMDALPIEEATGLPFAAEKNMHACGHDLHTASLLGAARILKAHEAELKGRVKLMFQPAEETLDGAKMMVDAGILENPKVDAAVSAHTDATPAGGPVTITSGHTLASSDRFIITVHGKGGHGSAPDRAIDPIAAAVQIHLALQEIKAREIPARDPASLTVGKFVAGTADNIIPDSALIAGTLRTYNNALRKSVLERVKEVAEAVAAAYRCRAEVDIQWGVPPTYNDPALTASLVTKLGAVLGEEFAQIVDAPQMASEDFSFVSQVVPSAYFFVPSLAPDKTEFFPHHHPRADFSEEALPVFAALYAGAAIAFLEGE
ncbi:M20 family metallopeptidase [Oscillospiraceae bacterium OttesenSCG-928-F05]|nr:M20 family metallopeptidase [Oscillospiraceae bacterium OttesenSCG-928-F05]